ncbi:MAG: hypothetical protein U0167_09860 [bacterium]
MRTVGLLVLLCALFNSPSLAEDTPTLRPGMRLRVTAPDQFSQPIVGTFVAEEPNALVVQAGAERIAVRRTAIQRLELSERRSAKKTGALVGAGVGTGLVIGMLVSVCNSDFGCENPEADRIAAWFAVGGGLGAVIGAGLAPGERWVELRRPSLGDRPGTVSGLRFAVSVGF